MERHPPGHTRTCPPFPNTTLSRSREAGADEARQEIARRHVAAAEADADIGGVRLERGRGIAHVGCEQQRQAAAARRAVTERDDRLRAGRSEEHTSELQSLMRISYAVFCLKNKKNSKRNERRQ